MEQLEQIDRDIREPQDCFELSDTKFVKLFRLNKRLAQEFIDFLAPHMIDQSRSNALTAEEKILCSLRFFAVGSYQNCIGDNRNIAMSQSSVSRSLHQVLDAVQSSKFLDEYVYFHRNLQELNAARQKFYNIYGFPGIVGCIDCTHVALVRPKTSGMISEHIYVNRKGYHSINVQLVCDTDLRILNVNAKYPGSTHDSFIWNNSNVLSAMEELHRRYPANYALLGDSGYALRPWMLTPLRDAHNGPEMQYNDCQMSARSIIERVNGILKARFRCLLKHRTLHYDPETASTIINTCCGLHNICVQNNIQNVPPEHVDETYDGMYLRNYNFNTSSLTIA